MFSLSTLNLKIVGHLPRECGNGKGMLSSVEQAFVGRDEIWAPLKTPAWEASCLAAHIISLTHAATSFLLIHPKSGVPNSPHLLFQSLLVIIMGSTCTWGDISVANPYHESGKYKTQVASAGHCSSHQYTQITCTFDLWPVICILYLPSCRYKMWQQVA